MAKKKSVERFSLSGKGEVCVFNEKSGCWEYECPNKGKLVIWFDPNEEKASVCLCMRVLDANGNPLPEKDNDITIAHAIMFDPMGLCVLPFRPVPMSPIFQLPFGFWMEMYSPEQTLSFPAIIILFPNQFGVEYLVIPERPELCSPSEKRKNSLSLRQRIIDKMKFFRSARCEMDEEINQKIQERNQQINEEWEEWERQQAEDWERRQTEKRKRQQKEEQDKKEEEQVNKEKDQDNKEESGE